jgi:ATP-dependent Clp protease adaptor protein ClpS
LKSLSSFKSYVSPPAAACPAPSPSRKLAALSGVIVMDMAEWNFERERDDESAVQDRKKRKRPGRWKVLLHNDEFTTMEFVVHILLKYFHKPPAEATHIMLQVHQKGIGVAGVYSKEVAETKVAEATDEARVEGMPLRLTAEPVEEDEEE